MFTIRLNYKEAFNLVPREWLIFASQLAKLPRQLIKTI